MGQVAFGLLMHPECDVPMHEGRLQDIQGMKTQGGQKGLRGIIK
jgi:hypothetical protein